MRRFYFECVIDEIDREVPNPTRDDVEAWVRHHFDEPDHIAITLYEERFDAAIGCLREVRVAGEAFRTAR